MPASRFRSCVVNQNHGTPGVAALYWAGGYAMTFREQKPAYRVFRTWMVALATLSAAIWVLAFLVFPKFSRHPAGDYVAIHQKKN
jgi:hypothetical protein